MSLNDEQILATTESFWEVGKFMRAVNRIDSGHSLCSSLRQLINSRAEIEKNYAKQLAQWNKKWNETLDKGMLLSYDSSKASDEKLQGISAQDSSSKDCLQYSFNPFYAIYLCPSSEEVSEAGQTYCFCYGSFLSVL